MTLILLYLVVLILVAVVLFGLGTVLFGRGERLPPLPRDTTATVLPASGVTGADVEAVKFTQALRGYKTSEVDWVLDRLGQELDLVRGELDAVRAAHGIGSPQDGFESEMPDAEDLDLASDLDADSDGGLHAAHARGEHAVEER